MRMVRATKRFKANNKLSFHSSHCSVVLPYMMMMMTVNSSIHIYVYIHVATDMKRGWNPEQMYVPSVRDLSFFGIRQMIFWFPFSPRPYLRQRIIVCCLLRFQFECACWTKPRFQVSSQWWFISYSGTLKQTPRYQFEYVKMPRFGESFCT
jgi:hypothetical protein